jgi:hypothetical protein
LDGQLAVTRFQNSETMQSGTLSSVNVGRKINDIAVLQADSLTVAVGGTRKGKDNFDIDIHMLEV